MASPRWQRWTNGNVPGTGSGQRGIEQWGAAGAGATGEMGQKRPMDWGWGNGEAAGGKSGPMVMLWPQGLASGAQGDWELSEQMPWRTGAKRDHCIDNDPMGRPSLQRWTNGDAVGRRTGQQWGRKALGSPRSGCHRGNVLSGISGSRLSQWGGHCWQRWTNGNACGIGAGQWVAVKWEGPQWMLQGKWAQKDCWIEDESMGNLLVLKWTNWGYLVAGTVRGGIVTGIPQKDAMEKIGKQGPLDQGWANGEARVAEMDQWGGYGSRNCPMRCRVIGSHWSRYHAGNGRTVATGLRMSQWGGCWLQRWTNGDAARTGTGQWGTG